MSYMCYDIAIRAVQKKSIDELYHIAKNVYGVEPEDLSTQYNTDKISSFKYVGENPISVYNVEGDVCIDYILKSETDNSFINESIDLKKIIKIKNWLKKSGFDIHETKLKVIYYHNGGCAGLCEVR